MKKLAVFCILIMSRPVYACDKVQSRFFTVESWPIEIQVQRCEKWDRLVVVMDHEEVLTIEPVPDNRLTYELNRLQAILEAMGPDVENLLTCF